MSTDKIVATGIVALGVICVAAVSIMMLVHTIETEKSFNKMNDYIMHYGEDEKAE